MGLSKANMSYSEDELYRMSEDELDKVHSEVIGGVDEAANPSKPTKPKYKQNDFDDFDDPIEQRVALISFKNQDPIMKKWDLDSFAYFLYAVYHRIDLDFQ